MHYVRNILFLFFCLLILSGCTSEPVASEKPPAEKSDYKSLYIVQHPSEEAILIDGTFFIIDSDTEFSQSSGLPVERHELKPGDLVSLTAHRETVDDIPGKGILLSLVRHDDERSQHISKAIAHVLENQEIGDIIAPKIRAVSRHSVTLQFYDWEKTHKYECIVNMGSLAFQVKELSYSPPAENP